MTTFSNSLSSTNTSQFSTSNNINILPADILIAIFTLVVSPFESKRANTQFRLAWVCRYWRQVIFENSQFWTTMTFKSQGSADLEYRELVFRKSGSRKLVLFSPGMGDIQHNPASWRIFRDFLETQSNRVKTMLLHAITNDIEDSWHSVTKPSGVAGFIFDNVQVLSVVTGPINFSDFKTAFPNLRALQLSSYKRPLLLRLPPRLKKLSLSITIEKKLLHALLSTNKELEYLSIFTGNPYRPYCLPRRITMPNLTTLKSNGSFAAIKKLYVPVLKHLEISAPQGWCTDRYADAFTNALDLSSFKHVYIGFTAAITNDGDRHCTVNWTKSIDGCFCASVTRIDIPCLFNQPTVLSPHRRRLTELPSSWSSCGDSEDEPLIHIHFPKAHNFTARGIVLPCKLLAQMTSLQTLFLCLPDSFYPDNYTLRWNHYFDLSKLFRQIAHPDSKLLNLVVRSGSNTLDSIEKLSEYFSETIWSTASCLESVTYHAPAGDFSEAHRDGYWEMWTSFITCRQKTGRPLHFLHIIGGPGSSPALSKLEELANITAIVVTNPNIFASACGFP